jgi:mono/diheme cytochrome c family protein
VHKNDPLARARELWDERCAGCHALDGSGGERGPDLADYNSRAWLVAFLKAPDGPLRMGPCKLEKGMKPVAGTGDELSTLAELVYAESGAGDVDRERAQRGRALFEQKDCDNCHELDGTTASEGPNLGGRGTPAYVQAIIRDASAPALYGKRNRMPRFQGKLNDDEIATLARFVLGQRRP